MKLGKKQKLSIVWAEKMKKFIYESFLFFVLVVILASAALMPALAQAGDTLWVATTVNYASPLAVKFSPDEKFVYVATEKGVEKHDAQTGALISEFKGKITGKVVHAKFSEDCSVVAFRIGDDSVCFWDIATEEYQYGTGYDAKYSPLGGIDLSPDGNYAYIGTGVVKKTNYVLKYNIQEKKVEKASEVFGSVIGLCISPDGKLMSTSSGIIDFSNTQTHQILWDTETLSQIKEIEMLKGEVGTPVLRFSPDSKKLAYNMHDDKVYNVETGEITKLRYSFNLWSLSFSHNNDCLAIGESDTRFDSVSGNWHGYNTLQLWSLRDNKLKKEYFDLQAPSSHEQTNIPIDISGFASGAYICRIVCGGKSYTEKFLIAK